MALGLSPRIYSADSMIEPGWTREDVISAFVLRGYQRIAGGGRGTQWYRGPASKPEATQYVVLENKSTARAFGVLVGFGNERARIIRRELEPTVRVRSRSMHPLNDYPCWSLFDAGRALGWSLLALPSPIDRQQGPTQFAQLCETFLKPVCENVTTAELGMERLMRVEVPFDWEVSNAVMRVAEVVCVARACSADFAALKHRLEALRPHVHPQWRASWPELIAEFLLKVECTEN